MTDIRVTSKISFASVAAGNIKPSQLSSWHPLRDEKKYTFQSPFQQYFTLPYNFMKYILKNPKSTEGLLKLYQTCKYFCLKTRIIIVDGKFDSVDDSFYFYRNPKEDKCIKNLKNTQLWFINDFLIASNSCLDYTSSKIYAANIKTLAIYSIVLDLEMFKLLTAQNLITRFFFIEGFIKNENGKKNLSIGAILEHLPSLDYLYYCDQYDNFDLETLKSLISVKFKNNLQKVFFLLKNLSETFDPKLLFKFIQQNVSSESCKIVLFCVGQNSAEIKSNLKIVENEFFPKEKRSEMFKISYEEPEGF